MEYISEQTIISQHTTRFDLVNRIRRLSLEPKRKLASIYIAHESKQLSQCDAHSVLVLKHQPH